MAELDIEGFAKVLHEAYGQAVRKIGGSATTCLFKRKDPDGTLVYCVGGYLERWFADKHHEKIGEVCPCCLGDDIEWPDNPWERISEQLKEARRIQARILLEHFYITAKRGLPFLDGGDGHGQATSP